MKLGNKIIDSDLDFKQFIFCLLQFFNPKQLENTYSLSSQSSILERQYQIEFYRIGTAIMGGDHFLSHDFGRSWFKWVARFLCE